MPKDENNDAGTTTGGKIWLSSAEDIAAAIGRNRHDIPRLVDDEGLPAFKFYGKWTALPHDIDVWGRTMAKKYRGVKTLKKKGI